MKTDFSNLPKHWKTKKLKEVVKRQKPDKETPFHRNHTEVSGSLPEWDMEGLQKGYALSFADWYSTIHTFETDIFVLRTGGRNGMIFRGRKGVIGTTLYCLTPLALDTDYLFYYLKTREFEHSASRDLKPSFWEMQIPIPPIEEQKHIVQSIQQTYQDFEIQNKEAEQKLLEALRKLVPIQSETLDNIIGLEDFKKAVLDLAVSGKMIKKEYDTPTKLYTILTKIEAGNSFKCLERPPKDNEIGVLKVSAISSKKYNENESKTCTDASKIDEALFVKKNDFLISRSNTIELVGACVIADLVTKKIMLSDKTLRLLFSGNINKKFILYSLRSSGAREQIEKMAKGNQESMKNIRQDHIENIDIFLPKIEEQIEIVNLVETIFEEADKIQQDYKLQKKQQDNLRNSIIQSSFQYSSFPPPIHDWDLDAQIKEAREKKEKEIKLLKEKQMAKRKEEEAKPKQDILSLLEEAGKPISVNELLENSKFNGNIDEFLAEAKRLADEGLVKDSFLEGTEGTETPLSMLSIIE